MSGIGGDALGSEALAGESEADYVARQGRLKADAQQRLRQKFGGSGGLGGGGMAGIGNSSGYNPATGRIDGDGPDYGAMASQVGSTLGRWGSALGAVATQGVSQARSQYSEGGYGEKAQSGWGSIAAGATSLWSRTSDAVNNLAEQQLGPQESVFDVSHLQSQSTGGMSGTGASSSSNGASSSSSSSSSNYNSGGFGGNPSSNGSGGVGSGSREDDLLPNGLEGLGL
jgi:ADP-ribosylation factor GTPase-activating protein 1